MLGSEIVPVVLLDFLLVLSFSCLLPLLSSPSRTYGEILWVGAAPHRFHWPGACEGWEMVHVTPRLCLLFCASSCPNSIHNHEVPNGASCLNGPSPLLCSGSDTSCSPVELPITEPACQWECKCHRSSPAAAQRWRGGKIGRWKEKEKPSFLKERPCCHSNQAPSRLFLSNVAPCPSSSLSLFILLGWRPYFPSFTLELLPSFTWPHQSPLAARGDGTTNCCGLHRRAVLRAGSSRGWWASTPSARPPLAGQALKLSSEGHSTGHRVQVLSGVCRGRVWAHAWPARG